MPLIVGTAHHPFAGIFNSLLQDMEHIDRGFSPYWKNNMNTDVGNELEKIIDNDDNFVATIDVSHFKPEELKVNLEGRVLSIEANQEIKDENSFFKRSFTRQFTLPEGVDVGMIKSSITPKGSLSIAAPKKGKNAVQNIPIVPALE